jgi:hypothetical protein
LDNREIWSLIGKSANQDTRSPDYSITDLPLAPHQLTEFVTRLTLRVMPAAQNCTILPALSNRSAPSVPASRLLGFCTPASS